mmetsp:Transcript_22436/g.48800  ORF Transcript_22436/g.48800 Transcript_22436/m.48800 type:complete len:292 (-) Transcript_22436:428-1303(-)
MKHENGMTSGTLGVHLGGGDGSGTSGCHHDCLELFEPCSLVLHINVHHVDSIHKALALGISLDGELAGTAIITCLGGSIGIHQDEQVTELLIVDLEEARLHGEGPTLRLHHCCLRQDLLHRTRDDSTHGTVATSLHGVCLSTTRLAVTEETDVVPIESTLNKLRHLIKDNILSRRGSKDLVKLKGVSLISTPTLNRKTFSIRKNVNRRSTSRTVIGKKRPRTNIHTDIPTQLLNTIVQRPTELLSTQQLFLQLRNPPITSFNPRLENSGILLTSFHVHGDIILGTLSGTAL